MKYLTLTLGLLMGSLAQAQTFGPPQIGWQAPIATNVSQCVVSAPHSATLCPVEVGVGAGVVYMSVNGSPFTLMAGATGPQGPIGPAGPTGATGPAGPVQSFVSGSCSTFTLTNTGALLNGCTEK